MRDFLRFFFSPSVPDAALVFPAVFFALLSAAGLGAFDAVVEAAGALLAVEAGYANNINVSDPSSM